MTQPFKTQVAAVNRTIREVLKNTAAQIGKSKVPDFKNIEVQYTLNSTRALGTCQSIGGKHIIKLNPALLNELKDDYLSVVKHEVCHTLVHHNYGYFHNGRKIQPHGREFKMFDRMNGGDGKATTSVASGSKTMKASGRNTNRFTYSCGCQEHQLTTVRHNKIRRGTTSYSCKRCGEKLTYGKLKATA